MPEQNLSKQFAPDDYTVTQLQNGHYAQWAANLDKDNQINLWAVRLTKSDPRTRELKPADDEVANGTISLEPHMQPRLTGKFNNQNAAMVLGDPNVQAQLKKDLEHALIGRSAINSAMASTIDTANWLKSVSPGGVMPSGYRPN